ncbi:MAG: hypothetical protein WD060_05435 [Pirellulales bacterium]
MSPRNFGSVFSLVRSLRQSRGTTPARRRAAATRRMPLAAEPLEPRAMLSTTADLSGDTSMFTRIPVVHGSRPANPAGNFVGQFSWSGLSGAAAAVGLPTPFKSFCVEGQQSISPGRHTFPTLKPLATSGVANAGLVEQFWRHYGPITKDGFATATDAAAFQLGIWELISDGRPTQNAAASALAGGNFKAGGSTAPAVARAAAWLDAWPTGNSPPLSGATVSLFVLQHPTKQDQVLWVPAVDLDVDSDNTGVVQGSEHEDSIEDIAGVDATPGKVLLVNDQDVDGDGIQDYFDGFNAFGTLDEDDVLGSSTFAELKLNVAGLPTSTIINLDYSASDPQVLLETPDGLLMPSPGHLRIWAVDASVQRSATNIRSGGHFIAPGTYSLQELGAVLGQTTTLFVEAIRPSMTTGDLHVTVTVLGTSISDRVRFTSTQFTVLGKALDEPFFETDFFVSSTLPSPAAVGESGIMPGAYREYKVTIHDPRMTTSSVQVGGATLPLTRLGSVLESPMFVIVAPGSVAHPSLTSIEVSGSEVAWAFNASGAKRRVTTLDLTNWDAELAQVIGDVVKGMDGTWNPANPLDDGAFGKAVHEGVSDVLRNRDGWAVDVYVDNVSRQIVSIGGPPPNGTAGTTQIDVLKLKSGYRLDESSIGQILDHTKIDDVYDVKTTASGIPNAGQATRLKAILNGGIEGGPRDIKIGMVERRWVKASGWVDNARYKNGIGVLKMLGLAAGVVQSAETAHAMWAFQDNDPEFVELMNKVEQLKAGRWSTGPAYEQTALFIKLEVNPFLRRRFGESAALNLASEAAFLRFLAEGVE